MTTTDEAAQRVLPAAFAAQADTCVDPENVLAAVRGQATRRNTAKPTLMIAAVVAAVVAVAGISATVAGISATVVGGSGTGGQGNQLVTAASGSHPGLDQLSGTCLDMDKVKTLWASESATYGGVGTGEGCTGEADIIQSTHPEVTSTVTAGNRKVYLTKAPAGIRAGFIALTPTESAAAVRASDSTDSTGGPQYLIVAISDDNPQAVLLSILTQYQLPS